MIRSTRHWLPIFFGLLATAAAPAPSAETFTRSARIEAALASATLSAFVLSVLPWSGFLGSLLLFPGPWLSLPVLVWVLPVIVAQCGLLRLYASFGVRPTWAFLSLPGALFVTAVAACDPRSSFARQSSHVPIA